MRKTLIIILAVILLASCGVSEVAMQETIEMNWGSIDLPIGWIVKDNDGDSITLSNLEEEHLSVYTNITENPKNLETWAVGYAVSSGRTPGELSSRDINRESIQGFNTQGRAGKITINETLYLIPLDNNQALSVVMAIPSESSIKYQAHQILDSIEVIN